MAGTTGTKISGFLEMAGTKISGFLEMAGTKISGFLEMAGTKISKISLGGAKKNPARAELAPFFASQH